MQYKSFIAEDNQVELRERLVRCMKMRPMEFIGFSKDIGITYLTLRRFLNGINVKFNTKCKIEAWCDKIQNIED